MSLYKKNILFIVIFTLCAFISVLAFVWIVDPFHVYHRDTWINRDKWCSGYGSVVLNSIQLEHARATDNYDTIFVGNSRAMNTDGIEMSKLLGVKGMIRLCTARNFRSIHRESIQEGLKIKKIKHVIIQDAVPGKITDVHTDGFISRHPKCSLFSNFALFSAFILVANHLFPNWEVVTKRIQPFSRIYAFSSYLDLKKFPGMSPVLKTTNTITPSIRDISLKMDDDVLLHFIRSHPNVTFYLLFPPIVFPRSDFSIDLTYVSFYVRSAKDLPNVKIYSFHDVPHYCIARNWSDITHFSPVFNKFMAYCIEHNLHRVTAKNYDAYKKHILDVLKSFNPSDYPDRPTTFEELVAYEESLHPELKEQKVEKE